MRRTGNSNTFLLAHDLPGTAPHLTSLDTVFGAGCDLHSVDSAAQTRPSWESPAGESHLRVALTLPANLWRSRSPQPRALSAGPPTRRLAPTCLFVEAPTSRQELQRITQAVPGRHIANLVYGGKTPMLPREDFAALGFAGVLYANAALQAAMLAMKRVMAHLQQVGSLTGAENDILGFEDRQKFVDQARWLAIEKRYGSTGLVIE